MALVYSCCFWFSLRLGGIMIGLFSIFQSFMFLICCCVAYTHVETMKEQINEWNDHYNIIYSQDLMDKILDDPQKFISIAIVSTCIYLIACVLYIYGAYICNNILMLFFITLELVRLILISAMVATGLLLLKENTMDIGSLIGASVVGGFFLLGMFYLWVCAANLPILINEMERDEQAATIAKMQQLLQTKQKQRRGFDNYGAEETPFARDVFTVSNKNKAYDRSIVHRSRIPVPY